MYEKRDSRSAHLVYLGESNFLVLKNVLGL